MYYEGSMDLAVRLLPVTGNMVVTYAIPNAASNECVHRPALWHTFLLSTLLSTIYGLKLLASFV